MTCLTSVTQYSKLSPNIILWGVGGEARWIGNEDGWAGETNWCNENRGVAPERNGMYGTENGWFWLPGESDAKFTDKRLVLASWL